MSKLDLCLTCRHEREAHEHWRKGTECSVFLCGCPKYKGYLIPPLQALVNLVNRFRR